MLRKKFRLKKEIAFSATFKLRHCKSNELITLYRGKDKDSELIPTKVGFIVSKKVHKRAVKRNKIKRRMREIYIEAEKSKLTGNLEDALSLIFIAKSQIVEADFDTIKNSMMSLIEKFNK